MTDKQIIIDGVDVTKCPSYMDFKKCTMLSYVSACEGSCAYTGFHNLLAENEEMKKQLKRKEQECEELKVEAEKWESAFTLDTKMLDNAEARESKLEQQLDKLKAENERLKKGIFKLDKTQPQVILTEGQVSLIYCTFLDMELKITKLKQTLADIKEIAITGLEGFCPKCSRKECEDNNCIETAIRDILQKISEVIE